MESCGARIAELRRTKGYTQSQLGEILRVSPQAVSKWEHDMAEPDIGAIRQMAALFGVTTDYLLGGEAAASAEKGENADKEQITAVCVRCGKALCAAEQRERNGKTYCPACDEWLCEQARREEERHTAAAIYAEAQLRNEERRSLKLAHGGAALFTLLLVALGVTVWFLYSAYMTRAETGIAVAICFAAMYVVYATAFECLLPGSILRKFYSRFKPKKPKSSSASGIAYCLLFLLFGFLFVLIVAGLAAFCFTFTGLLSVFMFPIDVHRARKRRKTRL